MNSINVCCSYHHYSSTIINDNDYSIHCWKYFYIFILSSFPKLMWKMVAINQNYLRNISGGILRSLSDVCWNLQTRLTNVVVLISNELQILRDSVFIMNWDVGSVIINVIIANIIISIIAVIIIDIIIIRNVNNTKDSKDNLAVTW